MPRLERAQRFLIDPLAVTRDPIRRAMSPAAQGVYDTLWLESWNEKVPGHLPANERILAGLAQVGADEWRTVADEVRTAFTVTADEWICKAIERSKDEQEEWRTRWRKQKRRQRMREADMERTVSTDSSDGTGSGVGSGSGSGSGTEKTLPHTPPRKRAAPAPKLLAPDRPPPPGVEPATWSAWFAHRAAIKKPLTALAAGMCAKRLAAFYDAGHDPDQIIENSIANGWQGLFVPVEERSQQRNGGPRNGP